VSFLVNFNQDIVFPPSLYLLATLHRCEYCPSVDHVVLKLAVNGVLVGKYHFALAMLIILIELALVFTPEIVHKMEIVIWELLSSRQLLRLLIVELAVTLELILVPLAVIGWFVLLVIKNTLAVDLVSFKMSLVVCTIIID
jgi:hypothetical protein